MKFGMLIQYLSLKSLFGISNIPSNILLCRALFVGAREGTLCFQRKFRKYRKITIRTEENENIEKKFKICFNRQSSRISAPPVKNETKV